MSRRFAVALHNENVRRLIEGGASHDYLSDDWGETHVIEVDAADEDDALTKVRGRYPADRGFVVEAVQQA